MNKKGRRVSRKHRKNVQRLKAKAKTSRKAAKKKV